MSHDKSSANKRSSTNTFHIRRSPSDSCQFPTSGPDFLLDMNSHQHLPTNGVSTSPNPLWSCTGGSSVADTVTTIENIGFTINRTSHTYNRHTSWYTWPTSGPSSGYNTPYGAAAPGVGTAVLGQYDDPREQLYWVTVFASVVTRVVDSRLYGRWKMRMQQYSSWSQKPTKWKPNLNKDGSVLSG
jgi:hypothetical protein